MRVSKIFLPLALAASAIAAGSTANAGPSLATVNQKSTEIISLIDSVAPGNTDGVAAQIENDLGDFVKMCVSLLNRQDPCDGREYTLFVETANKILNTMIQNAHRVGPLAPVIEPILRKLEDIIDTVAFEIIGIVGGRCPERIDRLDRLEKHIKQAEHSLGLDHEATLNI
ncbi:uncharacterized protein APUU_51488S [Aspergillus puulaauensis]|uniref:Secreted protein n=1 Tax=Aspergillus puulaauensis TaxID=1220207 RepID=A0A7R7XSX1_9EURO|nr:uncharacterized protein APUU_51488S [Aspergillus puulaauensis]BCS26777.1 hypothetical protein APUU_51488S [Aspergillus puulaauensis]